MKIEESKISKEEWIEERSAIVEYEAKRSRIFAENQSGIMYRNFLKVSLDYFENQNKGLS